MNHSQDYHIRCYQPGDENAITELFRFVFSAALTVEQWHWKYTSAMVETPLAMLALTDTGQLIGHAGAIPLRGWCQDGPQQFFQICDVMVHPAARGPLGDRNVFAMLTRQLLEHLAERWPDAFAYGFPGYRPFLLGQRLRIYAALERIPNLRRSARNALIPLLRAQPLCWEDSRLDALWARLAAGFSLSLVRDRPYLEWRYANNPFRSYEFLGLYLAGRLLGWAVILQDSPRLQIIDLLVGRFWLKPALAALDRVAFKRGLNELAIWLPPTWRKSVNAHHTPTAVIATQMIWRSTPATMAVGQHLYYTMGDLDIF